VIQLLPIGVSIELEVLDRLAASLAAIFADSCHVRPAAVDASFAFDGVRRQYHSTAILAHLDRTIPDQGSRVLGVTADDLFVPIFTFVFGEAQIMGRCAVVSIHRLREEFYGLPDNSALADERLLKEAVHELGHTAGLRHCQDWQCVMASSHSVDRLDVKETAFCDRCRAVVLRQWHSAAPV
jgi:archaemetzincin